jgi:hypothetical protein
LGRIPAAHILRSINPNNRRPHIRQHHSGEGARADSGEFDNGCSSERSGHSPIVVRNTHSTQVDDEVDCFSATIGRDSCRRVES